MEALNPGFCRGRAHFSTHTSARTRLRAPALVPRAVGLRYRSPFYTDVVSTETFVRYDAYDLLIVETRDLLGNRVAVGERNVDPSKSGNDYRVLQPRLVTDANRNLTEIGVSGINAGL